MICRLASRNLIYERLGNRTLTRFSVSIEDPVTRLELSALLGRGLERLAFRSR
jgi:hypothetical protein